MTTAFVIDARYAGHTLPDHPERAERLFAIERVLQAERLIENLSMVEAQPATYADLNAVHTPGYLARLKATSRESSGVMLGLDTYVLPQSYEIAQLAAGGVLRVVDRVLQGKAHNGLAAVRPPGHHATSDLGMGFCLLNNIAIAARYAQRAYPIERVAIVDYDVHHGNGTQDIFYADPSVLYLSTHQSPLYPGTGAAEDVGQGAGRGYTVNVPLAAGVGDKGYKRVWDEVVAPVIRRFNPDLILVSAGFDAHWADPLANIRLTLSGYDYLTRSLIALAKARCGGRIVFVLEGGYNVQALSYGWANVAHALLGDSTISDPLGTARGYERSVNHILQVIKQLHKLT